MRSWEVKKRWHWNFVSWWVLSKEHLYKEPCRKCSPKANSRPLFNLVIKPKQNSHCMQGIFIQTRYFEREFIKSFKKVNSMYSNVIRMSLVYTLIHLYVTRIYSYVIHMLLVCTRMSSICHSSVVLPWTELKYGNKKLLGNTKYNQVKLALVVFVSTFCIRFLFKFY